MRIILSLGFAFAFALSAFAEEVREYPLGDLAITYDPTHWRFEPVSESDPTLGRPAAFSARCIVCGNDAFVDISVADMARQESEAVLDPVWARDRSHSTMTVGEITIGLTEIHSPCRNYVPSSITARAAYSGHTYTFRSGVIVGCHGSSGVGSQRFEELLRGLHPRR